MTPNMYMHVFSVSVYSPLYLTTNTKKIKTFQWRVCKIWTSLIQLDAFFSLALMFALFTWTNVMRLSKQSLVRWRRFHGYHCPDSNTHIKNGRSFKKYSKFTPTIEGLRATTTKDARSIGRLSFSQIRWRKYSLIDTCRHDDSMVAARAMACRHDMPVKCHHVRRHLTTRCRHIMQVTRYGRGVTTRCQHAMLSQN